MRAEALAQRRWEQTAFIAWRVVQAWSTKPLRYEDFNPYARQARDTEERDAEFAAFARTLGGKTPDEALEELRRHGRR